MALSKSENASQTERAGALALALAWLFLDDAGCGERMAWEMQGPGLVFGETVTQKLNYLNVYLRSQETSLERKVSDEPGWVPTSGNKTRLLEDYRKALETREFLNHSAEARWDRN